VHLSPEYLAGFFDGEGCVSTNGRDSGSYLTTTIANSHLGILESIREQFGGSISQRKSGSYTLTLSTWKAHALLNHMLPYLIVKADVARVGIQLQERPKESPNSPERVKLRLQIQELNRRTNPSRTKESHDARLVREGTVTI
jgi:hypothetical protein